jgi:hypothetical protein
MQFPEGLEDSPLNPIVIFFFLGLQWFDPSCNSSTLEQKPQTAKINGAICRIAYVVKPVSKVRKEKKKNHTVKQG